MEWFQVVEKVAPYIVKIETPNGSGTGFIFHYYGDWVGIATAYHIIEHADLWHEPIRIIQNDVASLLQIDERIIRNQDDIAVIWRSKSNQSGIVDWPKNLVPLLPKDTSFKVGVEVGWLGFPWGGLERLHFFCGRISDFNSNRNSYFMDGTAINGVSGGPVLCISPDSDVGFYIIGSISAYMPNRATGETLPGLSVAQDVTNLHSLIPPSPE